MLVLNVQLYVGLVTMLMQLWVLLTLCFVVYFNHSIKWGLESIDLTKDMTSPTSEADVMAGEVGY